MHIAVYCITDAKSAAAVARVLGVTSLTVSRKIYASLVRELLDKEPDYTKFHIDKQTGTIASDKASDVVTVFPEGE